MGKQILCCASVTVYEFARSWKSVEWKEWKLSLTLKVWCKLHGRVCICRKLFVVSTDAYMSLLTLYKINYLKVSLKEW